MPKFALRFPYFIIMLCLLVSLVGAVNIIQMPVDLFPKIDMPVVVVATFYNGMPPEQIEADITNTFERFFTLGANIDHSESRSLTGVSLIKIYFKPGTDPNAALSNIANLAMADLRRLPPGTLPPVVLGMDASTQPVCLVTLKGQGLNETSLKDLAQFQVRNQISNVQGASVPQPYGGTYRQIQIYVDPLKLEARNLSLNDVVTSVHSSNLILPAGYVPLGAVANIQQINTPTEVDHNQIRRVIDIYVATKSEALQGVGAQIERLLADTKHDKNTVIEVRGAVVSMNQAFHDFGVGLIIAILLVYLILMAQFASFIDPFIILMAIPPGLAGVALILLLTGSSLNIMSLMGVIMMAGIVVSNSILIVEFAGILHHQQGMGLKAAVVESCKVRLRPILMTSLATLLGMIPMALGLEAGSEQYAPLARAIIGGLALSVVVTMFLVPAVYLVIHGRDEAKIAVAEE